MKENLHLFKNIHEGIQFGITDYLYKQHVMRMPLLKDYVSLLEG